MGGSASGTAGARAPRSGREHDVPHISTINGMRFRPVPEDAGIPVDAPPEACGTLGALLVGDTADPHVIAVLDRLPRQGTVVVDASTLPDVLRRLSPQHSTLLDQQGEPVRLSAAAPARGWIRRLAPAGWDSGTVLGSQAAARLASRMALLAAFVRDERTTWLCHVDALFAAENKMVQYRAACTSGCASRRPSSARTLPTWPPHSATPSSSSRWGRATSPAMTARSASCTRRP